MAIAIQIEETKRCSSTGCLAPALSKGLCQKHYQRWRRYGRTERVNETAKGKTCKLCDEPVRAKGLCASHHRKWLHLKSQHPLLLR